MASGETLRVRLGELARARRDGSSGLGSGAAAAPLHPRPGARRRRGAEDTAGRAGVEEFLPGGEWRSKRGAVYVHERLRSAVETRRAHWGRLGAPPAGETDLVALAALGLEHALFLDLETGGLASSPVFLAGTMHWNGEDFVLRQYFARHYGEEAALIDVLHQAARGYTFLITFNGKSYDAPFLHARAAVHGVPLALPARHLDLLHVSRRRWGGGLPDCRLQTLELHVTRRRRAGDVPGEEVPGLYHDFVRGGDPYRLVPVFHHNLLDVITMGEILQALCAGVPGDPGVPPRAPGTPGAPPPSQPSWPLTGAPESFHTSRAVRCKGPSVSTRVGP